MTVCVAAFAAKSRAIVLVSDKALTYAGAGMQSDTNVKKILPIGSSPWHALVAGDSTFADEVVSHCSTAIASDPALAEDVEAIIQRVSQEYQATRKRRIVAQILAPRLLPEDWLSDAATQHDDYFRSIADEAARFDCNCWLVICGFNTAGKPQMFSVDAPGSPACLNSVGMHAIGGGATFALGRLLSIELDKDTPLEQMLYHAFHAKADAEVIQGVGYEWDAVILTAAAATEVKKPIKALIEKVYNLATVDPFDPTLAEDEAPPRNWKAQLRKFSEGVLPSLTSKK